MAQLFEGITYEAWTDITTSVPFLIMSGIVWFGPLIFYTLIAGTTHARTASGKKLDTLMIQHANTFVTYVVFIIQLALWMGLIIFPVWLKLVK